MLSTIEELLALANGDHIKDKQRSRNSSVVNVGKKIAVEDLLKELSSNHHTKGEECRYHENYTAFGNMCVPAVTSNIPVYRTCQNRDGFFPHFRGLMDPVTTTVTDGRGPTRMTASMEEEHVTASMKRKNPGWKRVESMEDQPGPYWEQLTAWMNEKNPNWKRVEPYMRAMAVMRARRARQFERDERMKGLCREWMPIMYKKFMKVCKPQYLVPEQKEGLQMVVIAALEEMRDHMPPESNQRCCFEAMLKTQE
ncbi:hypothetical protein OROHE_019939 [Orobanche hederae]